MKRNSRNEVIADDAMGFTEAMDRTTAEEFGIRVAKAFLESRSSTALFFIQLAFRDCEDDNGIFWEAFERMLNRLVRPHDLYEDGDANIPSSILDSNGQVVLGLCKRCNRAEVDLEGPCNV